MFGFDNFWEDKKTELAKLQPIWEGLNKDPRLVDENRSLNEMTDKEYKLCYVVDPWVPMVMREKLEQITGDCADYRIYEFKVKLTGFDDAGYVHLTADGIEFMVYNRNYGKSWRLYGA